MPDTGSHSRPAHPQSLRMRSAQNVAQATPAMTRFSRGHGSFSAGTVSTMPLPPSVSNVETFVDEGTDGQTDDDDVGRRAVHRLSSSGSVQALVVDDDVLFAGLQGGDIVAWSLDNYEQLAHVHAHFQSVLGLGLSDDKSLLLSCGVDSIVNVWSSNSLERLYSLHSHFEIGDVFCVAFSSVTGTLFYGAQNSSIQWHEVTRTSKVASPIRPSSPVTPALRKHRFFDSLGPGGAPTPKQQSDQVRGYFASQGGQVLTVAKANYLAYAHRSYVYAMVLARDFFEDNSAKELLISAGGGGTIKLWSLRTLKSSGPAMVHKFKNNGSSVFSLVYKAPFLYAGLSNGVVHVYNLSSLQLVHKVTVGSGDITQIQILNEAALCGTSQGWVKQTSGRFAEIQRWKANDGKILASAILSKGDRDMFITGGNDNTIALWDVTGKSTSTPSSSYGNDELLSSLREFVAYRTVAADPRCARDCHQAVAFLKKIFNAFGAATSLLSPQDGVNPLLLARFGASHEPEDKKTLLFYGHYDVVDAELVGADGRTKWHSDPFTLNPLDGYLYGRGVTDNKGPILAALYAVADLLQEEKLSCNVVFLLEGDEEAGSRGFRRTVRDHKDAIGPVDFILLSNSYWLDDRLPCLTFGMRGVVHAEVAVKSSQPDLHSGMDGKSLQHEALKDLTVLIGSLIGTSGTDILIPGFYDTIDELQPSEFRAYKSIAAALMTGPHEAVDEDTLAQSLMQRWRDPNLTVHRISVPETKTAVTISRSAKAVLSIRIVPSQSADEVGTALRDFLHEKFALLDSGNTLDVTITAKADPWLGQIQSEVYEELREAIIEAWNHDEVSHRTFQAYHEPVLSASQSLTRLSEAAVTTSSSAVTSSSARQEPLFIREGGSIPAISFLEREFDAPAAMFPMGQASDNAHLDNERMRVENLYKGRDVLKLLFTRLGTSPGTSLRPSTSSATI